MKHVFDSIGASAALTMFSGTDSGDCREPVTGVPLWQQFAVGEHPQPT